MKNPIQFSFKSEIFPILILMAGIALSLWSYPQLPAQVVTHWNLYGQADGWSSREFHTIFFPALLGGIYVLFFLMPMFDPKRDRYQEFSGIYLMMRNLIVLVMAVVFAAATFSNLGYPINIGGTVAGAIGLMMIILGNYFGKLKRNWFVGIKTPWTLYSDNIWNKTHRLGGRLFMVWGFCMIIAPWLASKIAFFIIFGGTIIILFWITLYSYLLYKEEKKKSGGSVL